MILAKLKCVSLSSNATLLLVVRGGAEGSKQNQGGSLVLGGALGVDMLLKLETPQPKRGIGLAHLTLLKKQLLLMTELLCP